MDAFGVVVTVSVLVAIAVFVLLLERRRAKEIERDLGSGRRGPDLRPPSE